MSQDDTTSLALRLPIDRREMGAQKSESVLARDLHAALEVKRGYSKWIREQIERARLADGFDFCLLDNLVPQSGRGGSNRIDHALTSSAAKKISMLSATRKGNEVREYFIACEGRALAPKDDALVFAEALQAAGRLLAASNERADLAQATIEEQRPAVEFALDVIQGDGDFSTREAIKAVGSPVKLGPAVWKDLEKRGAFFVAAANGTSRHWRPCHVKAGFGYDCLTRIRGGRDLVMVPKWKPRGLPHLREFLISRQRQLAIRR